MLRAVTNGGGAFGMPYLLASSGAAISNTGNTTENVLATVTIPPLLANSILIIGSVWSYPNSANNKTARIRLGGIGGTEFLSLALSTTASFRDFRWIQNANALNAQIGGAINTSAPIGSTSSAHQTSAIDTTNGTTLVFTAQNASAAETFVLRSYWVALGQMS